MFVPLPPQMHIQNPQWDGTGKWLGMGGAFMKGISALMKEILVPCEDTVRIQLSEPGSRRSPDLKASSALILDFPASRTVQSKCLMGRTSHPWYGCYSCPKGLRHWPVYISKTMRKKNLLIREDFQTVKRFLQPDKWFPKTVLFLSDYSKFSNTMNALFAWTV